MPNPPRRSAPSPASSAEKSDDQPPPNKKRAGSDEPFTRAEDAALLAINESAHAAAASNQFLKPCLDWSAIHNTLTDVGKHQANAATHTQKELQARLALLKRKKAQFENLKAQQEALEEEQAKVKKECNS